MKKINFVLLTIAILSLCISFFLARSLFKKNPAVILSERSLTDTALSFFSEDVKALTAAQIALQQREINARILKLAEQEAQVNAQIADIPFWQNLKKRSFSGAFYVGAFCVTAGSLSVCLVFVRRKTLVPLTFGTAQISLPYRQLNSETGAVRVLQTVLTQITQGTLDKQDLFKLFAMSVQSVRGQHSHTQPMIDVTPPPENIVPIHSAIPTYREIIEGIIPGSQMVLGFKEIDGESVMGTFDQIYSCGFFGKSRSGKTTGLIGLICQSLLAFPGIRFVVIDPHHKRPEGLTANLPKTKHFEHLEPNNFRSGLYRFAKQLDRRLEQEQTNYHNAPLVLLIDELSSVLKHLQGASAEALIERIAREGAKVAVYCLVCGHDTRLTGAGNARDLLCSTFAYRLNKKQARYLLDDDHMVKLHEQVREAKRPGLCLFNPTDDDPIIVQQPLCTPQDVRWVESQFKSETKGVIPLKQMSVSDNVSGADETLETPNEAGFIKNSEDLPAILKKVSEYMEKQNCGFNEFCRRANIFSARGSLSEMLKSNRPLSDDMARKLMEFFDKLENFS